MNNSLVLVIVFYNPTQVQIDKLKCLADKYRCIVVDNSDGVNEVEHINVTYIPLYENKGIAYAQNKGIEVAIQQKVEFIYFSDQDSTMRLELPEILLERFISIKREVDANIGAIGPTIVNEDTGVEYRSHLSGKCKYSKTDIIISSGSLIPVSVLKDVSMLDSDLFIDYVDHDLCFKLTFSGFSIYVARDVKLVHKVGNKSIRYLGQEVIISAPMRYYYIYRNSLWLCRRKYVPSKWKIKNLLMLYSRIPLIIFGHQFSENRHSYLTNVLKGIKDGLLKTK